MCQKIFLNSRIIIIIIIIIIMHSSWELNLDLKERQNQQESLTNVSGIIKKRRKTNLP